MKTETKFVLVATGIVLLAVVAELAVFLLILGV